MEYMSDWHYGMRCDMDSWSAEVKDILLKIVGGIITFGIIEFGRFINLKIANGNFKAVFGEEISTSNCYATYSDIILPALHTTEGNLITHPYQKVSIDQTRVTRLSIEHPISSCEMRSIKYLSEHLGQVTKGSLILSSDTELGGRLDISFISFGGASNKSIDVLRNDGNNLVSLHNGEFSSKASSQRLFARSDGFDYGLILKIHPAQFPRRTWIACIGYGEWGTSGASWYLARKWKEIHSFARSNAFAIILRVRLNQDESAEPIIRIRSQNDAEEFASRFNEIHAIPVNTVTDQDSTFS